MAVPAGTGKAWANRGMREARSTEAWSANMGKARTAHATYMHAAEATGVHTATEMPTTAEMSAARSRHVRHRRNHHRRDRPHHRHGQAQAKRAPSPRRSTAP